MGRPKLRPKDSQPAGSTKKRERELASLVVGRSYLTHGPFNIACMQIVRFNSNGRFGISITRQYNLSRA